MFHKRQNVLYVANMIVDSDSAFPSNYTLNCGGFILRRLERNLHAHNCYD